MSPGRGRPSNYYFWAIAIMVDQEKSKRTLIDSVLLWGTACAVATLGVGFFLIGDELHFQGKWRLYLLLNAAFCAVMVWRFRLWFRHGGLGLLLIAWLVAHLLVYGLLTKINFNMFFCIFFFPAEATVLIAVTQVMRARHREKELHHRDAR